MVMGTPGHERGQKIPQLCADQTNPARFRPLQTTLTSESPAATCKHPIKGLQHLLGIRKNVISTEHASHVCSNLGLTCSRHASLAMSEQTLVQRGRPSAVQEEGTAGQGNTCICPGPQSAAVTPHPAPQRRGHREEGEKWIPQRSLCSVFM